MKLQEAKEILLTNGYNLVNEGLFNNVLNKLGKHIDNKNMSKDIFSMFDSKYIREEVATFFYNKLIFGKEYNIKKVMNDNFTKEDLIEEITNWLEKGNAGTTNEFISRVMSEYKKIINNEQIIDANDLRDLLVNITWNKFNNPKNESTKYPTLKESESDVFMELEDLIAEDGYDAKVIADVMSYYADFIAEWVDLGWTAEQIKNQIDKMEEHDLCLDEEDGPSMTDEINKELVKLGYTKEEANNFIYHKYIEEIRDLYFLEDISFKEIAKHIDNLENQ